LCGVVFVGEAALRAEANNPDKIISIKIPR
jgi:hypothetical protein